MNRHQLMLAVLLLARPLCLAQDAMITPNEYRALVQYHVERLRTTNAIALTAGEWKVLNDVRAGLPLKPPPTKWERYRFIVYLLAAGAFFYSIGLCITLKEKYDDWRLTPRSR